MFRYFSNFDRTFNEQTVETLIRHRALLHLIWVQTVCLCPPPQKKDVICAYGLVIHYDLHNYGKTTYGQIFHTIMSWLMTACVRSPVCLACAWILVQACQASVGTDVDGKSCLMRLGDMNWWLTPTPSNNLMKCNPKPVYPSVKQL